MRRAEEDKRYYISARSSEVPIVEKYKHYTRTFVYEIFGGAAAAKAKYATQKSGFFKRK